jgi:hypothetical protein
MWNPKMHVKSSRTAARTTCSHLKIFSFKEYLTDLDAQINMNTRKSTSPMKCVENVGKYSLTQHSAVWKPMLVLYNSCSTFITKCINVHHIHIFII